MWESHDWYHPDLLQVFSMVLNVELLNQRASWVLLGSDAPHTDWVCLRSWTVAGFCWKPTEGKKSLGQHPCLLTFGWPAGSAVDPAACKRRISAHASVCTAAKHVSFFWVAKVTPGLEGKHPTYCLRSWERKENLTRRQKAEQSKYAMI